MSTAKTVLSLSLSLISFKPNSDVWFDILCHYHYYYFFCSYYISIRSTAFAWKFFFKLVRIWFDDIYILYKNSLALDSYCTWQMIISTWWPSAMESGFVKENFAPVSKCASISSYIYCCCVKVCRWIQQSPTVLAQSVYQCRLAFLVLNGMPNEIYFEIVYSLYFAFCILIFKALSVSLFFHGRCFFPSLYSSLFGLYDFIWFCFVFLLILSLSISRIVCLIQT